MFQSEILLTFHINKSSAIKFSLSPSFKFKFNQILPSQIDES